MNYEKLERDGNVAVLVSPGFGAGWSTWADDAHLEAAMFDKDIAEAVLAGNNDKAAELATAKFGEGFFTGGARQLRVQWVPKGSRFEVHEYDGSESLRIYGPDDGYVA